MAPNHQDTQISNEASLEDRRPRAASFWDSYFHLRKGTAIQAARGRAVAATFRRGRGGLQQAWILPADAEAWFRAGLPIEPVPFQVSDDH